MNVNRIGIYPGSFNPFHIGHLDIVRQAQKVFDEVVIVRAINPEKISAECKLPENYLNDMGVSIIMHEGLVTDLIKDYEILKHNVTLIRGLRNGADLAYEQNLVAFMRNMYPEIKVVCFLCDPKYQHVSSSNLRGIRKFSEKEYRKYALG